MHTKREESGDDKAQRGGSKYYVLGTSQRVKTI